MMAIAISCDPVVILADEPTTALDVTVQRRVLDLLDRLVDEEGCALLLITHDLAVVSEMCDRVVTMYGGHIVESGSANDMLNAPRHPYTEALLLTSRAVSVDGVASGLLPSIAGSVPAAGNFPHGCPFRDRCEHAIGACVEMPPMVSAPIVAAPMVGAPMVGAPMVSAPMAGDGVGSTVHAVACWNPVGEKPEMSAREQVSANGD